MAKKAQEDETEDMIKECLKLARKELNAAEYARLVKACESKKEE
ncbi:MAG: hypothetical protein ACFFA5_06300 [Promethearchaeota archaeon]